MNWPIEINPNYWKKNETDEVVSGEEDRELYLPLVISFLPRNPKNGP